MYSYKKKCYQYVILKKFPSDWRFILPHHFSHSHTCRWELSSNTVFWNHTFPKETMKTKQRKIVNYPILPFKSQWSFLFERNVNYVSFIFCLDLATKSSPSPRKKAVQATLPFGKQKTSAASKSTSAEVKKAAGSSDGGHSSSPVKGGSDQDTKDNSFREFRRICVKLAEEPSYNAKSKILSDFFKKGSSGGMCNLLYSTSTCSCRLKSSVLSIFVFILPQEDLHVWLDKWRDTCLINKKKFSFLSG